MSVLQVGNLHFESSGNNRLQYTGSNGYILVGGGSVVATINTTTIEYSGVVTYSSNTTFSGNNIFSGVSTFSNATVNGDITYPGTVTYTGNADFSSANVVGEFGITSKAVAMAIVFGG